MLIVLMLICFQDELDACLVLLWLENLNLDWILLLFFFSIKINMLGLHYIGCIVHWVELVGLFPLHALCYFIVVLYVSMDSLHEIVLF